MAFSKDFSRTAHHQHWVTGRFEYEEKGEIDFASPLDSIFLVNRVSQALQEPILHGWHFEAVDFCGHATISTCLLYTS